MPTATVPGLLLDAYGRPTTVQGGIGTLHRRTTDDQRLRPVPPNHFSDQAALLASHRYREIVSEARVLGSRGLFSALIDSKAGYVSASHWRPRFTGRDTEWSDRTLPLLLGALNIANLRGSRFSWRASWRLSTRNFAEGGGFFVLLTTWPDTEQPAFQFLEAHRIGQRAYDKSIVGPDDAFTLIAQPDGSTRRVRGAYRGLAINNGIITTPLGTEVAYRVLGAAPEQDQDISARDLIYVAPPKAYSESRALPDAAASLLDFLAIDLAQTCQLDQQIADSRLTFIETTATGRPDAATTYVGGGPATTDAGTPTEVYERAGTRFIKSGNALAGHQTGRPSDQWMNFDKRVATRGAVAGLRWPVAMLDPESLRGAATRAFQDQVNTSLFDDFHAVAPAATRCVHYAVAKLIKAGVVDDHPEALAWEIAPPPAFEVDRASARIDLEEVAAGRTAMSTLHARDGHSSEEVYRARARDYKIAQEIADSMGVPVEAVRGADPLGPRAENTGTRDTAADERSPSSP